MSKMFQPTEMQKCAIEARNRALLVSAAAGSGKTKVLVERLVSFLLDENEPCDISEFLIITYTRAAAGELRQKIEDKLRELLLDNPNDRRIRRQLRHLKFAQISTVHSFCASLVRDYAWLLEVPGDFRVGEENETELLRQAVASRVIKESYDAMTAEFEAFASQYGSGRNDRDLQTILLKLYVQASARADERAWLEGAERMLERKQYRDYSETVWGEALLRDLRETAIEYQDVFQKLLACALGDPGLETTVAVSLSDDLNVLARYTCVQNWAEAAELSAFSFQNIKRAKKTADPVLKERIMTLRKECKDTMRRKLAVFANTSEEALQELECLRQPVSGLIQLTLRFMEAYRKEKRKKKILDYSDLEHLTLELLYGKRKEGITAAAKEIRNRFRAIFVDEYQDSNEIQDSIFTAVSKNRENLFLVGDVKQSIYGFRLANPGIFLKYYKAYPTIRNAQDEVKESLNTAKVLLGENFRSRREILEAVNDVFRQSMTVETGGLDYGEDEALHARGSFSEVQLNPVELHVLKTQADKEDNDPETDDASEKKVRVEARFVAERINEMLRQKRNVSGEPGDAVKPGDIAILLRSPGKEAAFYAEELEKLGIDSCCDSGTDIMATAEIQLLISLVEILKNPDQDIYLAAVIMSPLFAFTANDMVEIRCPARNVSLFKSLKYAAVNEIPADLQNKLMQFHDTYDMLTYLCKRDGYAEAIDWFLERSGAFIVYHALERGSERIEHIEYFRTLVHSASANGSTLWELCSWLHELEEKGVSKPGEQKANAVLISSIHKSKGLEYPVVFLGMMSKKFNEKDLREKFQMSSEMGIAANIVDLTHRASYPSIAKQAIAMSAKRSLISEELRILYVAMTRPKHLLVMVYSDANPESKMKSLLAAAAFHTKSGAAVRAGCLGDWVLMHALKRTEGVALRRCIDEDTGAELFSYPWNIQYHTFEKKQENEESHRETESEEAYTDNCDIDLSNAESYLSYQYPYRKIGRLPMKITATQLKGRLIDNTVSDGVSLTTKRDEAETRKKPGNTSDILEKGISATKRGTAIHNAMQFIRFASCTSSENVQAELERLVREGFLSQEKAELVDPEAIVRFFDSDIGKRTATADDLLREFKFSVMLPAEKWFPDAKGEQFLVQGVVDCCIFEKNEITVIDFKSDEVTEKGMKHRAESYRFQIDVYSEALSQIFGTKVKERVIYFFKTGKSVIL